MKLAALIFTLLVTGSAASAQEQEPISLCLDASEMLTTILDDSERELRMVGISSTGEIFELYLDPQGEFIVVTTTTTGVACIRAFGSYGEMIE